MNRISVFFKKYLFVILSSVLVLSSMALIELSWGQSLFGPDGNFGWWASDFWGSENSQRVADAYSFSHIIHGLILYLLIWFVLPKLPLRYRFLLALIIESAWELFENSQFTINRYRQATISIGYTGDSVLNSVSDIGMMAIGFIIARFSRVWVSVAIIIFFELICLYLVRDNLTLNILMLTYPIDAIKDWQMAVR